MNKINEIDLKVFQGQENLDELDINSDLLTNLEERLFKCLQKLKKINLRSNKIAKMNEGLCGVENLEYLDFDDNKLLRNWGEFILTFTLA